jgi:hypothetical protein
MSPDIVDEWKTPSGGTMMRYRLEPKDVAFSLAVAGIHKIEFFRTDCKANDGVLFLSVYEASIENAKTLRAPSAEELLKIVLDSLPK